MKKTVSASDLLDHIIMPKNVLLATKLRAPPARSMQGIVTRVRLIGQLKEGLNRPLTLVSAPAGSGKTTLLSEWFRALASFSHAAGEGMGVRVAWLSLDDGDNDPARFLTYLIVALKAIQPEVGETALSALRAPQLPPPQAILTALINDLATTAEPLALVLEDYHVITAQAIHEAMTFLLDHLPQPLHLIISSRIDPPLPLSRLRAGGQLTEIRAEHLRFTPDEAAAFLNQAMKLNLSAEQIAALEAHTEGWIAGLQLAALAIQSLAMRGQKDIDSFVHAFTGSNRYIFDYLIEQVLQQQPDAVREFLLTTSILERLCGPLCDAVIGRDQGSGIRDQQVSPVYSPAVTGHRSLITDSQSILEQLERANLFLVPLDDERRWYRYHHLFADVLRNRLRYLRPEQAPVLQRRASEWHECHGTIEEAVAYAMAARDTERATRLVEENAWAMLRQGRVSTLLEWMSALPEEELAARPRLGVPHAWGLFMSGKEDQMVARVQQIEAHASSEQSGEVILLLAIGARWRGDVERSLALTQQALERLPQDNLLMRAQGWINLGVLQQEHDAKKAQRAFAEAGAISEACGDIDGSLRALRFLAETQRLAGTLRESAATCEHALQLAKKQPYSNNAGYVQLKMAELLYERNELERATMVLQKTIELAQMGGMRALLYSTVLGMAGIHRARGEWEEAQRALRQAEQLAQQAYQLARLRAHTFMAIQVAHEQVRLCLARGRPFDMAQGRPFDMAQGRLPEVAAPVQETNLPLALRSLAQTALARALMAQGEPHQALPLLAQLLEQVESAGMSGLAIQALVIQALALAADGHRDQACSTLARALSRAEPEGYIRTFVDEGEPMQSLIADCRSQMASPPLRTYVDRLLSAFPGSSLQSEVQRLQSGNLVEPLSERELEVLRLIAAGLSNQEIAERLVIAMGTVKAHTSSIYGKLSVGSRTQAVARARELNLI